MKPRVIIFGIGTTCRNFFDKQYHNEYEIVGVSDWDEKKHGTSMYGHEVINPYEFDKYNFDYVLIVSYYVKEIKAQLQERCNISEDKIMVPPKYQVKYGKPFEDAKTHEFGHQLLIEFTAFAEKGGINLFLDYGTLLGVVRDGSIIPWDDDIDFSINQKDAMPFMNLLLENKNKLPFSDIVEWMVRCQRDDKDNIWNFNLFFTNKQGSKLNEFDVGIGVNGVHGDRSVSMRGRYLARPSVHFEKYEYLDFNGNKLKVPYKHIEYLNFVYGDWGQPKVYQFGQQYGYGERTHMPELKPLNEDIIIF